MKATKRMIANIVEIVVGVILTILGYTDVVDSYWSGMGTALIFVGIIFLFRTFRYKTNTEYKEKVPRIGTSLNSWRFKLVSSNASPSTIRRLPTPTRESILMRLPPRPPQPATSTRLVCKRAHSSSVNAGMFRI